MNELYDWTTLRGGCVSGTVVGFVLQSDDYRYSSLGKKGPRGIRVYV
jgi:hypothetical protein